MRSACLALLLFGCGGATPRSDPADETSGLSEREFMALHELSGTQAPAPRGEHIEIDGARAYLSLPRERSGGAVIVIHEWWGLNDHIRHWTDRLAAEGYAALAVDLYGGEVATDPERAMELMRAVDEERASAILASAHRFLVEDRRVQAERTAAIGWCFGGAWALRAAIAIGELDAAVMYYGRVVDDVEALRAIRAPLLGIFANRDTSITVEQVDAFERALAEAGVEHRLLRYDADHAFANPSGARYAQREAADAWENVRAFLGETLR